MFAEDLMLLGIAGAVPPEAGSGGAKASSAALTAALGDTALQAADPGDDLARAALNELNPATHVASQISVHGGVTVLLGLKLQSNRMAPNGCVQPFAERQWFKLAAMHHWAAL